MRVQLLALLEMEEGFPHISLGYIPVLLLAVVSCLVLRRRIKWEEITLRWLRYLSSVMEVGSMHLQKKHAISSLVTQAI